MTAGSAIGLRLLPIGGSETARLLTPDAPTGPASGQAPDRADTLRCGQAAADLGWWETLGTGPDGRGCPDGGVASEVGGQGLPTAAVVVDIDGVVSGWSEGGRLLLGWTTREIVGGPVKDLLVDPPPGFPGSCRTGVDASDLLSCATATVPWWTPWSRLTCSTAPTAGPWVTY